MHFRPDTVYHVFNQGNNKQIVFFKNRNYTFFLEKMKEHLLPNAELLCYCLMPNHFHWLLYPSEIGCSYIKEPVGMEYFKASEKVKIKQFPNQQQLSRGIGNLLSSYTRAVNRQENRSGSLFRQKTKAKDNWTDGFITADDKSAFTYNNYPEVCFQYIHENPVEAGLVFQPEDWRFSSARDYSGQRKQSICNRALAAKLLGWDE